MVCISFIVLRSPYAYSCLVAWQKFMERALKNWSLSWGSNFLFSFCTIFLVSDSLGWIVLPLDGLIKWNTSPGRTHIKYLSSTIAAWGIATRRGDHTRERIFHWSTCICASGPLWSNDMLALRIDSIRTGLVAWQKTLSCCWITLDGHWNDSCTLLVSLWAEWSL